MNSSVKRMNKLSLPDFPHFLAGSALLIVLCGCVAIVPAGLMLVYMAKRCHCSITEAANAMSTVLRATHRRSPSDGETGLMSVNVPEAANRGTREREPPGEPSAPLRALSRQEIKRRNRQ